MLILVYKITGKYTPSIFTATCVAEVESDKIPRNQAAFAARHGGDFIDVAPDPVAEMAGV